MRANIGSTEVVAEKKVTWLELFYDLLFVAAVSKANHVLLHSSHGTISVEYLIKFVLIFIPIWWSWVGQTLFNNRFGQDIGNHRIFMIFQLFFVLIMTASLSVNFDRYYISFFVGYIGSRALTAIQYLTVHKSNRTHQRMTAKYLGTYFWVGIVISTFSLFFDSWIRYAILYAGIAVDIMLPLFSRRYLIITPTHTHHLLERFGLFTLILIGESVISILTVLQSSSWTWTSILFAIFTFVLVIAMWWQYFDNLERKVSKEIQTAGQTIIYGHVFIYVSMGFIAASIQLLFQQQLHYPIMLGFIFGSVLIYFISTSFVFHRYRQKHTRLRASSLAVLLGLLGCLYALDNIFYVPNFVVIGEIMVFFIIYAKVTT